MQYVRVIILIVGGGITCSQLFEVFHHEFCDNLKRTIIDCRTMQAHSGLRSTWLGVVGGCSPAKVSS